MMKWTIATGLAVAIGLLVPTEQGALETQYGVTPGSVASVGPTSPIVAAKTERSAHEQSLNIEAQHPVVAIMDLSAPEFRTSLSEPTQAYSDTMHNLAAQMLALSPDAQSEVVWLAKALAFDQDGAPPGSDLSDHLSHLAQFIGDLSSDDRQAVVDLAISLQSH